MYIGMVFIGYWVCWYNFNVCPYEEYFHDTTAVKGITYMMNYVRNAGK